MSHDQLDQELDQGNVNWYMSEEGEVFGVILNLISEQDLNLISALFQAYKPIDMFMNETERKIYRYLYLNEENELGPDLESECYRFVYFTLEETLTDLLELKEALQAGIFLKPIIIFKNMHEGVILLQEKLDVEDSISFSDIQQTMVSDFYANISLFVGRKYKDSSKIRERFQWELHCFSIMKKYKHGSDVTFLSGIIPYLLVDEIGVELKTQITHAILEELLDDDEMLKTIKVFLECNLNASLTAKTLFIHRNSLQYRIDKFVEKTGINVREFEGAVSAYLALQCARFKST